MIAYKTLLKDLLELPDSYDLAEPKTFLLLIQASYDFTQLYSELGLEVVPIEVRSEEIINDYLKQSLRSWLYQPTCTLELFKKHLKGRFNNGT